MNYQWPNSRKFAFTICDDTDNGTLENLQPIYAAIAKAGLRTTKTVWSMPCVPGDPFAGQSLSDPEYARWVIDLARQGFEIGWHGNRSGGSNRSEIVQGLGIFRKVIGNWPRTYANHANNLENLYWGPERFDLPLIRKLFLIAQWDRHPFLGSCEGSENYWADICSEKILYVRDFTFDDIVTTNIDPWMPYWDPNRPLVRSWFSSSNAADVRAFTKLMHSRNLDRLEHSGGACILYVHLASGFVIDGHVNPDVLNILCDLARRPGWYVPVDELMGHMESIKGVHRLSAAERSRLETKWAAEHFHSGLTTVTRRLFPTLFSGRAVGRPDRATPLGRRESP